MSEDDTSWDLAGLGKLAKAIPATSWNRMIKTACETFEQSIAPWTATTSGLGRLLSAKFNRLVETEKINAAAAFAKARSELEKSGQPVIAEPSPKLMSAALEGAAAETDEDLQTLWGNLIAREVSSGGVHPIMADILAKLMPEDARTLAKVADTKSLHLHFLMRSVTQRREPSRVELTARRNLFREATTSEAALEALGLIGRKEGPFQLSALGEQFIKTVQGRQSAESVQEPSGEP